jgi:hypothetical protein
MELVLLACCISWLDHQPSDRSRARHLYMQHCLWGTSPQDKALSHESLLSCGDRSTIGVIFAVAVQPTSGENREIQSLHRSTLRSPADGLCL